MALNRAKPTSGTQCNWKQIQWVAEWRTTTWIQVQCPKHSATLPTPWIFLDGVHLLKNVPVIFWFIFNLKLLCCSKWEGGYFGPKIHCHCKLTVVNNDNVSLNKKKKELLGKNHFKKGSLTLVCTNFVQYKVRTNSGILDFNRGLTL